MPLYEYECNKCHRHTEKIESASGPHLRKCPHCGCKVERVLTAPAIQFKGTGWYVTDYSGKKGASGETTTAESVPAKDAAKEPAKESTAKEPVAKESKERKSSKK